MKRGTAKAWFLLFRPWSYTATVVPFLLAAACSRFVPPESLHWGAWGLGIVSGLLFQATVNLLNTWGDEASGVDDVPGAIRTTPQVHDGLVSMRAVLWVALTCALSAAALGAGLCFYRAGGAWHFNVPLLVTGFVGFLGSVNYSTGIKFKYRGLGVPFVSFLMGPLEVLVAFLLLAPCADGFAGRLTFLSLPLAALVGVIMHGNDMRDIPTDRAAGIRSWASVLNPGGAFAYFWLCHVGAYLVPFAFFLQGLYDGAFPRAFCWLVPFLALPASVRVLTSATRVYVAWRRETHGLSSPPWRKLERGSGGVHFLFGLLYALTVFLAA